jgi:soluble lytic murein transglycosylase
MQRGARATILSGCSLLLLASIGPCTEVELAEEAEAPTSTEAPPQPPSLTLSDLELWQEGSPQETAAAQLRAGLNAFASGKFETALTAFDAASEAALVAPQLVAWKRGQSLLRLDRPAEAIAVWAAIPDAGRLGPAARLAQAQAHYDTGNLPASLASLESFPVLDDDGPKSPSHLRAELLRGKVLLAKGGDADRKLAYAACGRAWAHAGGVASVSVASQSCLDVLETEVPKEDHLGLGALSLRAVGLGRAHSNAAVIELLKQQDDAFEALQDTAPNVACRGKLELGRAWHKKRKYSESLPRLSWAAEHCPESDAKIRAHYLRAQGLQRAGRNTEAISAWTSIADLWPSHRFADDGLFHVGEIALQGGDISAAKAAFTDMAKRFPDGDMVPAGLWGMAWAAIESGDRTEALRWLAQQADLRGDGPHYERVLQARYWSARLQLDGAEGDSSQQQSQALSELEQVALDAPFNWYGLLAFWRVHEASPERAEVLAPKVRAVIDGIRSGSVTPEHFVYERAFGERPGFTEGLDLLRSGLPKAAVTELRFALGKKPWDRWSSDTLLLGAALLSRSGAPNFGHELLRRDFRTSRPGLRPADRPLWVHAYPTAFGQEIATAAAAHPFDRWLFQGLVREESAFTATVKSWAGAMGLSQLMWATARESARKMGIGKITRGMLSDPELNLKIGSWYLARLHDRWNGHLALAIGSYNAGPGAENRWVKARGDLPIDAYVETIPFKQTRLYTKHVYASYQTYYALYGEDHGPFVPLRVGSVRAAISSPDPKLRGEATQPTR